MVDYRARRVRNVLVLIAGLFLFAPCESEADKKAWIQNEYNLSAAEYDRWSNRFGDELEDALNLSAKENVAMTDLDGYARGLGGLNQLQEAYKFSHEKGYSMPEIIKYCDDYGGLSNFKEAVELDMNTVRYKEYKSHETACKTDWKQCADNAQLVNKWNGWVDVRVECETEAKDRAKYGTPEFPWFFPFSKYKPGKDYIEDGLAVVIEPDAKFENGFGAKVRSRVTCLYDLKNKRVVEVRIEDR